MLEYFEQLQLFQAVSLIAILILFIIQLIYWLGYKILARHRHHSRLSDESQLPPVSVVVIVDDNPEYVYEVLPKLLTQDHPQYEVVVVNDCGGVEVTEALSALAQSHARLRYTVINPDDKFKHSRKVALLIGIKAARYENLVFTHTDTLPGSDRWLTFMAKGFRGSDVVISYNGFEPTNGITSKLIRCANLCSSIRYLKAASIDKAYKGTMRNMGYTKRVFFGNRGFTHLRLALGEDDLMIQKITNDHNTAVIINPYCTTRSVAPATAKQWNAHQRYYTYPYRYYPFGVKFKAFCELFTRAIYHLLTIAGLVLSVLSLPIVGVVDWIMFPYVTGGLILGLLLLREFAMLNAVSNICKRLGESGLMLSMWFYDKAAPYTQMMLALSRRIKPPHGLWR